MIDPLLSRALKDVEQRHENLPAHVHGESPRLIYSRILAGTPGDYYPTYEGALHQAALYLALAVAIDRSEERDPLSGEEAVA